MKGIFRFKQFDVDDSECAMKIGTDAVLLGASATAENPEKILDAGTGSGVIALMLAQRFPEAFIDAIDISTAAASQAAANFRNSPWASRLNAKHCSLQLYAATTLVQYDLIVCNPPFFSNSLRNHDHTKTIARHNDLLPPDDLFRCANALLKSNGALCIILPFENAQKGVLTALSEKIFLEKRTDIIAVQGKKAKRSILTFTKQPSQPATTSALRIREKHDTFSPEFKELCKDFYLDF